MDNNQKADNQISIEINPDVAKGTYSNLAIITHSNSEFIMDFASLLPGMPKANVVSRIISTPQNAKRLLNALQDNVIKYEARFGTIDPEMPSGQAGGTINLGDIPPFGGQKS